MTPIIQVNEYDSCSLGGLKFRPAHQVGIFLEGRSYHHYNKFDLIAGESGGIATRRKHPGKKHQKTRASSIANFEKRCKDARLDFTVHKDREVLKKYD